MTTELSPMKERVCLVTMGTAAAAPTPATPPTATLPAMTSSSSSARAATRTLPPAMTVERDAAHAPAVAVPAEHSSPIEAWVVMSMTETAALTATPTVPPPDPPAEIERIFSVEVASIVTFPFAATAAPGAIQARVSFVMTCTSTPAPTPAVPPRASWPAFPPLVV